MLSPEVLSLPRLGCLNVHPSLLPAYRGPAPINWAIINGDAETGVTTMLLDQGMDTGPLYLSQKVKIRENETAGELHDRLAILGAELLVKTIAGIKAGTLSPTPQPQAGASVCRLLKKSDGLLDFTRTAGQLAAQVRGMDPWPGAFSSFKGKKVSFFKARPGKGQGKPGQVLTLDQDRLHIAAGQGSLAVAELQMAGKKRQSAQNFWHGQRLNKKNFFGQ
jgi:methionyl-tRNA formyltransferase